MNTIKQLLNENVWPEDDDKKTALMHSILTGQPDLAKMFLF